MKKEKVCGIYCIENLVNNKKYIGKSKNIYGRWNEHKYELDKHCHYNRYLQNAWDKYGEANFKFYILEECRQECLDNKERYYIDLFKTHAHFGKHGYNLTIGGEGIGVLSEEERQKFREVQKSIPIYQIDLNGNIVKKWTYGAREASKTLGIDFSAIWNCVNYNRKTYKNYIWISEIDYIKGFCLEDFINQNTQAKVILQYDAYGNLLKIWDSANSASKHGYDCSSIIKVCKRQGKLYKDCIWCYEYDNYITPEYILSLHEKDFIKVYDKNNVYYGSFRTQTDIVKTFNLNKSSVSQCLSGDLDFVGGYRFEYSPTA